MVLEKHKVELNDDRIFILGWIKFKLMPTLKLILTEQFVQTENYIYIYILQSWPKISAPLVNYDKRSLWKLICIVNPFDLFFFKSNLSLDNTIYKWGELSLWNVFLKCTLDTIIGTPGNSYE